MAIAKTSRDFGGAVKRGAKQKPAKRETHRPARRKASKKALRAQPVRVAVGGDGKSPLTGTAPPAEHQFKKGFDPRRGSGDTAGAITKNYLNGMARHDLRTSEITAIARDKAAPHMKRVAAKRLLAAMNSGSDFDRIVEHTEPTADQIEKYRRIDEGRASERVGLMPAMLEVPILPPKENANADEPGPD